MIKQELKDAHGRLTEKRKFYKKETRLGNSLAVLGVLIFAFSFILLKFFGAKLLGITAFGVILVYIGGKVNNRRILVPLRLSATEEEFLKVFEALHNLDTYFKYKIEFSKIEAARKISKFEGSIHDSTSVQTLWKELTKDRDEHLPLLKQNLRERLLPIINWGREEEIKRAFPVIEKIAEYLLNPTVSGLEDLNKLMSGLPKKEKVPISFFERYPKLLRYASVELLVGLLIVLVISFVAYYIGVKFLNTSIGSAYTAAAGLLGALIVVYVTIVMRKR